MTYYIQNIYDFLKSIIDSIITIDPNSETFFNKSVFYEASLIGLNITYYELFIYLGILILSILFIIIFIRLVNKFFYLFK